MYFPVLIEERRSIDQPKNNGLIFSGKTGGKNQVATETMNLKLIEVEKEDCSILIDRVI